MRFHLYEKKYKENESTYMTTRLNLSEDYLKLPVFSIQQKVPADKPALFQWWLKARKTQKEK